MSLTMFVHLDCRLDRLLVVFLIETVDLHELEASNAPILLSLHIALSETLVLHKPANIRPYKLLDSILHCPNRPHIMQCNIPPIPRHNINLHRFRPLQYSSKSLSSRKHRATNQIRRVPSHIPKAPITRIPKVRAKPATPTYNPYTRPILFNNLLRHPPRILQNHRNDHHFGAHGAVHVRMLALARVERGVYAVGHEPRVAGYGDGAGECRVGMLKEDVGLGLFDDAGHVGSVVDQGDGYHSRELSLRELFLSARLAAVYPCGVLVDHFFPDCASSET